MKRFARTVIAVTIATAGLVLGAGHASAEDTGAIIGLSQCEQIAAQYRAAGYSARCNHIQGDRYYVHYERPNRPSTGSAGSS
jgi:hypothetical protein